MLATALRQLFVFESSCSLFPVCIVHSFATSWRAVLSVFADLLYRLLWQPASDERDCKVFTLTHINRVTETSVIYLFIYLF